MQPLMLPIPTKFEHLALMRDVVRLISWFSLHKRRMLFRVRKDRQGARESTEVTTHAQRVRDLWDEADIRKRRIITERPRANVTRCPALKQTLHCTHTLDNPMLIPRVFLLRRNLQHIRQVFENAQVVKRVDITRYCTRELEHACAQSRL